MRQPKYKPLVLHIRMDLLKGRKFGRLTVLHCVGTNKWYQTVWACVCECGAKTVALSWTLKSGHKKSCGTCIKFGSNNPFYKTGKYSKEFVRESNSFRAMHDRCKYPSHKDWANYGGRGIAVCDRWSGSKGFTYFLKDMGRRPAGTTLDRKDVNGHYTPKNCRWATWAVQRANQRNAQDVADMKLWMSDEEAETF